MERLLLFFFQTVQIQLVLVYSWMQPSHWTEWTGSPRLSQHHQYTRTLTSLCVCLCVQAISTLSHFILPLSAPPVVFFYCLLFKRKNPPKKKISVNLLSCWDVYSTATMDRNSPWLSKASGLYLPLSIKYKGVASVEKCQKKMARICWKCSWKNGRKRLRTYAIKTTPFY